MQSIVQQRGVVQFPENTLERVYMRPFLKQSGLPADLARWQPTVDAMLNGVETDETIYIMIDQAFVKAGTTHRRAGLHIDGYWIESLHAHGHIGNKLIAGRHGGHRGTIDAKGWEKCDFSVPEALILASDVQASRAFVGEFAGKIGDGGDCAAINVSKLVEVPLQAGVVYAGNVAVLHESMPVERDCFRTLVRLNVPGWTPVLH